MPIHRTIELQSISDSEFAEIDAAVMRCAYASRNHFGRLFDERIYENDIAARLRAEGFEVFTQVPVKLTHGSFEKSYYLDLVVNQMLYELKAVAALISEHSAQALHYAMLQDIRLVKLLNFGEDDVRGKLLKNALHGMSRHQPTQRKSGWHPLGANCEHLVSHLKELIRDWGTHLDCRLYEEALVHHFGGEAHCMHRAEIISGERILGTHPVQFHSPRHAFVVTGFSKDQERYRQHLRVLLAHAPSLEAIQWINLNRSRLEITTMTSDGELDNRMADSRKIF